MAREAASRSSSFARISSVLADREESVREAAVFDAVFDEMPLPGAGKGRDGGEGGEIAISVLYLHLFVDVVLDDIEVGSYHILVGFGVEPFKVSTLLE